MTEQNIRVNEMLSRIHGDSTCRTEIEEVLETIKRVLPLMYHVEDKNLAKAIYEHLKAMKTWGISQVELNAECKGRFAGVPSEDIFRLVKILASRHPLKTRLIVVLGTLLAMADVYKVDIWNNINR